MHGCSIANPIEHHCTNPVTNYVLWFGQLDSEVHSLMNNLIKCPF